MKSAIVLLSGGQDSTTCLFWAASFLQATRILALSINYGQRHWVELEAAQNVIRVFRDHYPEVEIEHEVLEIGPLLKGTSPLVDHSQQVESYEGVAALPGGLEKTFVPGRNILFLTITGNRALTFRAQDIVTGTAEEDFGGYPDCRRSFINAMQSALNEGLYLDPKQTPIRIHTPLMFLSKGETVQVAQRMKGAVKALGFSHTCYNGQTPPCGSCHSCLLRGKGFRAAGIEDPLITRLKRLDMLPQDWDYPR